ncbi:MAG: hypothetical protein ABI723_18920 [Bacteroidia bacterium]
MIKYKLFKCRAILRLCKISAGIILCIIFFNRCNECGCIDQRAINYNSTANKNDGSCEYCDTTLKLFATKTISLKDNNSASTHYNQVVARFVFEQDSSSYNDMSCGDDACMIFLHIESQVSQEMEFTYKVFSSYPLYLYSTRHIILPANVTYNADTVNFNGSNPCSTLNSSIGVLVINGNIVYH